MSAQTAVSLRSAQIQVPVLLISLGHGATHWVAATLYLLLPFIGRDLGLNYTETGLLMTCFYDDLLLYRIDSGQFAERDARRPHGQAHPLSDSRAHPRQPGAPL